MKNIKIIIGNNKSEMQTVFFDPTSTSFLMPFMSSDECEELELQLSSLTAEIYKYRKTLIDKNL